MKKLTIQIQGDDLDLTGDTSSFYEMAQRAGVYGWTKKGDHYINATFTTEDLFTLWKVLSPVVKTGARGRRYIVVCEGDEGWEDYYLLYHFDPDEKCDVLLA